MPVDRKYYFGYNYSITITKVLVLNRVDNKSFLNLMNHEETAVIISELISLDNFGQFSSFSKWRALAIADPSRLSDG